MKTSYKFKEISRLDDVHIDRCVVRFFEGDVTTLDEMDFLTRKMKPVTRYRPTAIITDKVYTDADFGVIASDDELRVFLNGELRKDKVRVPVDEQNTLDITKVK